MPRCFSENRREKFFERSVTSSRTGTSDHFGGSSDEPPSTVPREKSGGWATFPVTRLDQGCRRKIRTETANGLGGGVPASPWGRFQRGGSHCRPRSAPESFFPKPSAFRPLGDRPPPFAPHFSGFQTMPGEFFQKIRPEMEMVAEWPVRFPLGRLSHEERFQRGRWVGQKPVSKTTGRHSFISLHQGEEMLRRA